jgi:hypothetical protein
MVVFVNGLEGLASLVSGRAEPSARGAAAWVVEALDGGEDRAIGF